MKTEVTSMSVFTMTELFILKAKILMYDLAQPKCFLVSLC